MTPVPLPDAAAVWAHPDWSMSRWTIECGRNHKTVARRMEKLGFRRNTRSRILAGPCVACGWIRDVDDLDERARCLHGCHGAVRVPQAEPSPTLDPAVELCRAEFAEFLRRPAGQLARAREHALEVRDKLQGEVIVLAGRAA